MPVDIQKMSYESSVTIALLPSSFVNIVSSYMSQKNEILKIILGCIFFTWIHLIAIIIIIICYNNNNK